MTYSILDLVKKNIGIAYNSSDFDTDLITVINSVFVILGQMGVNDGHFFSIDENTQWNQYMEDSELLEIIKLYVCLKTRYIFDTPTTGAVKEAVEKTISELEWRISIILSTTKQGGNI